MTRAYSERPVWTWRCDTCRREHGIAREQSALPTPDDMRALGWWIAPLFGDLCPACYSKVMTGAPAPASDFTILRPEGGAS